MLVCVVGIALLLSADDHRLRHRYLLACEALSTTQKRSAFTVFERTFQTRRVAATRHSPGMHRPGASRAERRLERMHLTPKLEATRDVSPMSPE